MPELGERGGTNPSGLWEWIKSHSGIAIATFAAGAAVWYLFMRQSSGGGRSSGPSQISFPAGSGGGATGGGSGSGGVTAPTSLPFSPDFSILRAISDSGLRNLYEQAYQTEGDINQATLNGNTSLLAQLQTALQGIQTQISNYQVTDPTVALRTQIANLNQTITSLRSQVAAAPTAAAQAALQAQIATLGGQVVTLTQQLAAAQAAGAQRITATAVTGWQRTWGQSFPNLNQIRFDTSSNQWIRTAASNNGAAVQTFQLRDVFGQWASGVRQIAGGAGYDTSKLTNSKLVALWNNFTTNAGAYNDPNAAALAIQDFVTRVNAGLVGDPGQITVKGAGGEFLVPASQAIGTAAATTQARAMQMAAKGR